MKVGYGLICSLDLNLLNTCILTDNILEQKRKLSIFQERHQGHKNDAQDALEYYRNMTIATQFQYTKITSLLSKEKRTKSEENPTEKATGFV